MDIELVGYILFLLAGLVSVLKFKEMSHYMAKIDKTNPFRIPDKWLSYNKLVFFYKIFLILFGSYVAIMSLSKIISKYF